MSLGRLLTHPLPDRQQGTDRGLGPRPHLLPQPDVRHGSPAGGPVAGAGRGDAREEQRSVGQRKPCTEVGPWRQRQKARPHSVPCACGQAGPVSVPHKSVGRTHGPQGEPPFPGAPELLPCPPAQPSTPPHAGSPWPLGGCFSPSLLQTTEVGREEAKTVASPKRFLQTRPFLDAPGCRFSNLVIVPISSLQQLRPGEQKRLAQHRPPASAAGSALPSGQPSISVPLVPNL